MYFTISCTRKIESFANYFTYMQKMGAYYKIKKNDSIVIKRVKIMNGKALSLYIILHT